MNSQRKLVVEALRNCADRTQCVPLKIKLNILVDRIVEQAATKEEVLTFLGRMCPDCEEASRKYIIAFMGELEMFDDFDRVIH